MADALVPVDYFATTELTAAPAPFPAEEFRVFTLTVPVHREQVLPADDPPEDGADFRARWWPGPDADVD